MFYHFFLVFILFFLLPCFFVAFPLLHCFLSKLAYAWFHHPQSLLVDCLFCVFPLYIDAVQQRSSRLSQEGISAQFFSQIIVI